MIFRKLPAAVAALGLLLTGGQALAQNSLPDFCIEDSPYTAIASPDTCTISGGSGFQADLFNGSYNELAVVFDDSGTLRFNAFIVADWNSLLLENAAVEPLGLNVDYDLYATVETTGIISGPNTFIAESATMRFFVDDDNDTNLGPDSLSQAGNAVTWNGGATGDDRELARSNELIFGSGTTSEAGGQDGFAILFGALQLIDPEGLDFFTAPRPFYVQVFSDGDINDGNTEVVSPGVLALAGDVSANMRVVPEPSVIALLGLGILGVALSRRKSSRY